MCYLMYSIDVVLQISLLLNVLGISNALIMQKLAQHLSCNPTLLQEFLCIPNVRKVMQCMCECYNSLKNQVSA